MSDVLSRLKECRSVTEPAYTARFAIEVPEQKGEGLGRSQFMNLSVSFSMNDYSQLVFHRESLLPLKLELTCLISCVYHQ